MSWYDERDPKLSLDAKPKKIDFLVVGKAFKAKGHGAWAWKKGMRADRGAKSVVDYRDEKHVWLSPRSKKRRQAMKAMIVDEAIKSSGIITLKDKRS